LRSEPQGSLDWLAAHATSDNDGEGRPTGSGILQQILDLIGLSVSGSPKKHVAMQTA